jgi:hypothetical protein
VQEMVVDRRIDRYRPHSGGGYVAGVVSTSWGPEIHLGVYV